MIQGRCPICSKTFQVGRIEDLPTFPFCSERCRLIDLGRWIDESYTIPGPPAVFDPDQTDGAPPSPDSNGRVSDD
jgi:endogenous inhibitor of DNA gyrase (YacG/DUF329 family)